MNWLRKIQYNCRKATFLIEKRQAGKITLREKIELRIHLAGCSVCRTFELQSVALNGLVKRWLHGEEKSGQHLPDSFKQQLQEKIESELDKPR
jgi:hypothetical protein